MARILLVEPYRILQQAIAVSLGRDYQVQVRESLPATELNNLKDCDVLVLDASSLEEKDLLTAELLRALASCEKPLLWLEDEHSLAPPRAEKFTVLKKPLQERALREAVESLLVSHQDRRPKEAEETSSSHDGPVGGEDKNKKAPGDFQQSSSDLIDLVEVIGEPAAENRRGPRKTGK
jgi:hypothetical protein